MCILIINDLGYVVAQLRFRIFLRVADFAGSAAIFTPGC